MTVSAIYEPPQEGTDKLYKMQTNAGAEVLNNRAEKIAKDIGLIPVRKYKFRPENRFFQFTLKQKLRREVEEKRKSFRTSFAGSQIWTRNDRTWSTNSFGRKYCMEYELHLLGT